MLSTPSNNDGYATIRAVGQALQSYVMTSPAVPTGDPNGTRTG